MYKNIKIKIENDQHSENVQKTLFSAGCKWGTSPEDSVRYIGADYIYVSSTGNISYGVNAGIFKESEKTECRLVQTTILEPVPETVELFGKSYYKNDVIIAIKHLNAIGH